MGTSPFKANYGYKPTTSLIPRQATKTSETAKERAETLMNLLTNPLETLNPRESNLLGLDGASRLCKATSGFLRAPLELSESERQLALKPIGLRLNTRPYNKLSKEADDFNDYKDEYIYTQHQILNEYRRTTACL